MKMNLLMALIFSLSTGSLGAGFILGQPTGLSFSYIISHDNFSEFALAWAIPGRFHFNADFLFQWDLQANQEDFEIELPGRFTFYSGPGLSFEIDTSSYFGIRADLGLRYEFKGNPIDIFLEVAPGVRLFPETTAFMEGGIGGRFYFFKKSRHKSY